MSRTGRLTIRHIFQDNPGYGTPRPTVGVTGKGYWRACRRRGRTGFRSGVVLTLDEDFSWLERRTASIESALTQHDEVATELHGVTSRLDGGIPRLDGNAAQLDGVTTRLDSDAALLDGVTTRLVSRHLRTPPDPAHRER